MPTVVKFDGLKLNESYLSGEAAEVGEPYLEFGSRL